MLSENRFAFKEWAVVCEALARGQQSLILRKGGIHEGSAGFQVEHREFWLFPTRFHQQPDELVEEGRPLIAEAAATQPPAGNVRVQHYAVVADMLHITEASRLPTLSGLHIWSEQTVLERFHYRRPGLFLLVARIYSLAEARLLTESPHFAGCRSWVDFPEPLPTDGLRPVLSDEDFAKAAMRIRQVFDRANH